MSRVAATIQALTLAMIGGTLATGPAAAVQYHARCGWYHDDGYVTIEQITSSTPPVYIHHDFPLGPVSYGTCMRTAAAWFIAESNLGELSMYTEELPRSGAYGSCRAGGASIAETTFDVTFSCGQGVSSPITPSMNFQVGGSTFFGYPGASGVAGVRLEVTAGLASGDAYAGTWAPERSTWTSNGIFTGIAGDALAGNFHGPTFSVALDASGQATRTIVLRGLVDGSAETPLGHTWIRFLSSDGPDQGLRLPVGTPVFNNLPSGCTCNSVEARISNNIFSPTASVGRPETGPAGALCVSPNPVNSSAPTFRFAMPAAGQATLEIFDVAGRRVAILLDGYLAEGPREALWSGETSDGRIPRGVYYARLTAPDRIETVKFVYFER